MTPGGFIADAGAALAAIPPAEAVAVLLAFGYLLLAVRQNAWCWVCAILSSAIFLVLFAQGGLVMQAVLQVFYIVMGVYGWWSWRRGGDAQATLAVTRWSVQRHALGIGALLALTLANGWLVARSQGGLVPYVDAFVAWVSMLATWMVARKVLENWLYWIVVDTVAAALYWSQGFQATTALFVVYVLIAVRGYFAWRADLRRGAARLRWSSALVPDAVTTAAVREAELRALLRACAPARPLADGRLTPIEGGLSNEAWRLDVPQGTWFVRRGHPHADRLGVDRPSECAVLRTVAAAGLAPDVLACDPAAGVLVTRFIDGATWSAADVTREVNLQKVAAALRRLHALPVPEGVHEVDYERQAQHLAASLPAGDATTAVLHARAAEAFRRIAVRRFPLTLCHNDLHHLNLLDDGQRLWLVDWEYGGRGNPLFDLASFLALADLGPVPTEVFLDAYGWPRSRDGGLLEDARWLFDYVQWLWYRSRFPHPVGDEAWYAERLAQRLLRCNN